MNDKQKSNKYIEAIKKLSKSSRGKAILFFIFYFIFFFILIAFLRSSYNNYEPPTTNTTIHSDYKISGITNGNYHFIREELINNNLTTFTGDKADNKVEGLMTTNDAFYNYFIYDNIYMLNVNNNYEVTNSFYNYYDITSDNNLSRILNNATLISKTEYEIGTTTYNYQITTNTLAQIVNNTNIDIADIPNTIILETNEDDEVVKIIYILDSYASYLTNTPSTVQITISYSNFNQIDAASLQVPTNE